jgi:hypothetical protein
VRFLRRIVPDALGAGATLHSAAAAEQHAAAAKEGQATCRFITTVNVAAKRAESQKTGLRLLASFSRQFSAVLAHAPAAMQTDLRIVFTAARTALDKQRMAYLATDQVAAAGARLTGVCG